jgi:regulator of protease activity HflC (stomatin/prohibitin superfamily)
MRKFSKASAMMLKFTLVAFLAIGLLESCAIVRPGEVGVKTTLGKLKDRVYEPGVVGFNPFVTKVLRMPTRTVNREVKLNLPSKEGLNVSAEISILYHITPEMAPKVIAEVGRNYEEVLILSVFRSASADVCSRFMAKELHSGQRSVIEGQIQAHMDSLLAHRGFAIESVLLKSISLPPGLYAAIENKLEAEQVVKRMEFELQQEQVEAERIRIEATGVRDAQKILSEGLTPAIIQWRSLEVLQQLSSSPNSKLIITDGKAPVLIGE